ncbi:unnamed protein product [Arabis nemorensis]|uniref:Reverse transcriptase zinc-binding domain-containing protein n=1 Tax=Arabis nemorensis TaxID=586526 RepID=A0A565B4A9_9BRAS|nr:unnamed protein product [Arabis nemorensis]
MVQLVHFRFYLLYIRLLSQGALPVRYLVPHKLGPQDYRPLIDKVISRISSWSAKHLSYAGRLQLIQSVIMSIINFWCSVFLLPNRCLHELERICSAFLWSSAPNSARSAKLSWETVCTPKKDCGLGLRRLLGWN